MALRIFILFLFLPFLTAAQTKKVALLIGIGAYPESLGWRALHGKEDAERLRYTLLKKGFRERDIYMLLDSEATIAGIRKAFRHIVDSIGPGDQVFIFFSGHGQQVSDDDWPEKEEPDGYDECLIPYDCPFFDKKTGNYTGELHFRDDEFATVLKAIRLKAGVEGHVFVAVDACHSGSVTRSENTTHHLRGTKHPLVLRNAPQSANPLLTDDNNLDREQSPLPEGMAPMVAFFAGAAGQDNVEIKDSQTQTWFGPFSRSLCNALEAAPQQATYAYLYERLETEIKVFATNITPTKEGNLNAIIMNGRLLNPVLYLPVEEVINPDYVLLPNGILFGLYGGARIALYPPDTWDTIGVTPIAVGIVDTADHSGARVRLENPVYDEEKLRHAWAFVQEFVRNGKTISYRERMAILRDISLANHFLEFGFDLLPFQCDTDGNFLADLPQFGSQSEGSPASVLAGDCFKLRVRNLANRDIYFAILDFMPDSVQVLHQSGNHPIKRGAVWTMQDPWKFLPPYGLETFKIIASDKPLPDLGPVIQTRSASGPDNLVQSNAEFAIQDIQVLVTPKQ